MSLDDANYYRTRAAEERRRAREARPVHRATIIELAESMERLADAYERAAASLGGW